MWREFFRISSDHNVVIFRKNVPTPNNATHETWKARGGRTVDPDRRGDLPSLKKKATATCAKPTPLCGDVADFPIDLIEKLLMRVARMRAQTKNWQAMYVESVQEL